MNTNTLNDRTQTYNGSGKTRATRGRRQRRRPRRSRRAGRPQRVVASTGLGLPSEGAKQSQGIVRTQPVADSTIVRLRAELKTTTTDIATYQDLVVSGSSVFDPFTALGSAQPVGFDQWAAFYNQYRVLQSRVWLEMTGILESTVGANNSSYGNEIILVAAPKDTSSAIGSIDDHMATQYASHLNCSQSAVRSLVTPWMSTRKLQGYSSAEMNPFDDAAISANPTDEWFWHLAIKVDQKAGTNPATVRITTEFEVEFFFRNTLGLSLEDRLHGLRLQREEYLKLKAMTPGKTGRLPPKPTQLEQLRDFVEGAVEEKLEKKTPSNKVFSLPTLSKSLPNIHNLRS